MSIIIKISNVIRVPAADLPEGLVTALKEKLVFDNPLYHRNIRYGRPNTNITPYLFSIWQDSEGNEYVITKGFLAELARLFNSFRIPFEVEDKTQTSESVDFRFNGFPMQITIWINMKIF